jgi:hypothetical protein
MYGTIFFEETLYRSIIEAKFMVDCLKEQNIVPGIKVDKVCAFNIQPSFVLWHVGFVSSAASLGLSLRIVGFVFHCKVLCLWLDLTMRHGVKVLKA